MMPTGVGTSWNMTFLLKGWILRIELLGWLTSTPISRAKPHPCPWDLLFPPRFLPLPPPFPFSRGSLSSWQGHGCGKRPRGAAPRCFGFRANCTKPVFFPVRSVWWLPANFPPSNSIGSSGRSFFPDWNSILTEDRPTQPTIAGWWLTYPSEKYESQLGWLISQYMEQIKLFQTSNQYRYSIVFWCYHVASIDIL